MARGKTLPTKEAEHTWRLVRMTGYPETDPSPKQRDTQMRVGLVLLTAES